MMGRVTASFCWIKIALDCYCYLLYLAWILNYEALTPLETAEGIYLSID